MRCSPQHNPGHLTDSVNQSRISHNYLQVFFHLQHNEEFQPLPSVNSRHTGQINIYLRSSLPQEQGEHEIVLGAF